NVNGIRRHERTDERIYLVNRLVEDRFGCLFRRKYSSIIYQDINMVYEMRSEVCTKQFKGRLVPGISGNIIRTVGSKHIINKFFDTVHLGAVKREICN